MPFATDCVDDFECVPTDGAWPELPEGAGAGLARLLAEMLQRAGVSAAPPALRGRVELGDEWRARWGWGTLNEEANASLDQAHHLLYRILEHAARAREVEIPAPLVSAFHDLQTVSPGAMLAYWAGLGASDGRERRRHWTRAFELDGGFVAARVGLARELLDSGGEVESAAALVRGLPVQDAAAASDLGLALWAAGDVEVAAGLLEVAVRADADNAVAAAALAAMLARRGVEAAALDEALLLASHATQRAPNDYRCWAALADVHRARGDYSQATFYYASALRLEPNAAGVLKDAGACWLMARRPDRALELIERALAAAPDDAEVLGNLAFAHDLRGDHSAALEAARRAAQINPDHARLRILHGDLALKAGRRDEALKAWARAVELEPGMTINPEGGNIGLPAVEAGPAAAAPEPA